MNDLNTLIINEGSKYQFSVNDYRIDIITVIHIEIVADAKETVTMVYFTNTSTLSGKIWQLPLNEFYTSLISQNASRIPSNK